MIRKINGAKTKILEINSLVPHCCNIGNAFLAWPWKYFPYGGVSTVL